ncbi:MAG TPA: 50S ribosomal protein L32 [Candidatus Andersenbacteria bacterium]|nr:50S ribosomal protein L32 [Candidatus Andersenbacteria bacterium]
MPVPKKHHTKSKVGRRRSHLALKKIILGQCTKCKRAVLSHSVCNWCGIYAGKEVIDVLAKLSKKEKKLKEKELAKQEKEQKTPQEGGPLSLEEMSKR